MAWFEINFIPVPREYVAKEGLAFATNLAEKAQLISLLFYISGWVLIMLGILLGVAGSVLGADPVMSTDLDQLNLAFERLFSQRGLICNTFAIIIAGLGRQFLERAKAAWLEGRVDDTQLNEILNKLGQDKK